MPPVRNPIPILIGGGAEREGERWGGLLLTLPGASYGREPERPTLSVTGFRYPSRYAGFRNVPMSIVAPFTTKLTPWLSTAALIASDSCA